jgi:HK97 family phage prohead protease
MKEGEIEFIRKGLVSEEIKFDEGERAVISYITTYAKDRDGEIVDPKGAILTEYRKNPIVLFCHDSHKLPVGKNIWIKADEKGLIAKTVYASHEEADKVYQYRKEGFPLAESIGFIPLSWTEYTVQERAKNGGVRRKFDTWLLLEYSDVPVPSNPEATMIAVSKGLIADNFVENESLSESDDEDDVVVDEVSEKSAVEDVVVVPVVEPEVIAKDGRVLSAVNIALVTNCIMQMKEACMSLETLLSAASGEGEAMELNSSDGNPSIYGDEIDLSFLNNPQVELDLESFSKTLDNLILPIVSTKEDSLKAYLGRVVSDE